MKELVQVTDFKRYAFHCVRYRTLPEAPSKYCQLYRIGTTCASIKLNRDPICVVHERTVSMRKMVQGLVLVVACIGLAACATNWEPTYGERIQDEGSSLKAVGE